MKKLLFCILVLVMSMTFIACGSDDDDKDKEDPTPTEVVTSTPEATPEVTPEATPEATAVPTESLKVEDTDNGTSIVDPEVTDVPEVTDAPEITETPDDNGMPFMPVQNAHVGAPITDDELLGTWGVDRDALFQLCVDSIMATVDEDDENYEVMYNYVLENRASLEENFSEVYKIKMAFEDGVVYLFSAEGVEEGLYELTEQGVGVWDANGEFQEVIYDADLDRLVLVEPTSGMEVLFYKESLTVMKDTTTIIDEPEVEPGTDSLTGDPVYSISEVAGTWSVDINELLAYFKEMLIKELGGYYTEEQIDELIAEGGMFDELFDQTNIIMVLGEDENYMQYGDERQDMLVETADFGLKLYNADDPSDIVLNAYYNAADETLSISEDGMVITFRKE